MAFEPVNKVILSNIGSPYTTLSGIADACTECDWLLHDYDYETTNPYAILKSHEDATYEYQSPCYVGMRSFSNSTSWIKFSFFLDWDADTNTYKGIRAQDTFDNDDTSYSHYVYCNTLQFGALNCLTIYGNKYFLNLRNYIRSTGYTEAVNIFKFQHIPHSYYFKIMNSVGTSTHTVLQLEGDEVDNVDVGDITFALCKDNHTFSKVIVESKSTVSGTITAEDIAWPTVSGSYIGNPTTLYPWAFTGENSYTSYYSRDRSFWCYNYGKVNDNYANSDATYIGYYTGNYWWPRNEYSDALVSVGNRTVIEHPVFYYGDLNEVHGSSDYRATGFGSEGDLLCNNKLIMGQVTSATSNTLTEVNKSWEIDEFAGKALIFSCGIDAGDVNHIISNTSDTLTIYGTFDTIPDSTTMFSIFDAIYVSCIHTGNDHLYSTRIA